MCFPNPAETDFGVFIHRRMRRVADQIPVLVLAPVPVLEYGNPKRILAPLGQIPQRAQEGGLDIRYPRWFYPPLGGWLNGPLLGIQMLPRVWGLARSIDLIDAHFAHPEGVAAALLSAVLRRPFVVTLRGNETDHAVYAMRRWIMGWALRRAARVITVSERLRQFAISLGCEPRQVVTIPNGIDGTVFYRRSRDEARREWSIGPRDKVILSAGYLIERKGHHRLVEALRGVIDQGVEAQLLIAGGPGREGDYEAVIRKMVTALNLEDHVRFLGPVKPDALARLMSLCDVFALATSNEGWPNVVHEAMACGAPVVATDIGAIPEMIQSSEFGYVVPFGDKAALEKALADSLCRDWNRDVISRWALGRSWDNVAAEVVALMREVVAEKEQRS
jgi:glycosyltransferase involved in cell wall biosynthesis